MSSKPEAVTQLPTRLRAKPPRSSRENEPPGFAEAWQKLYGANPRAFTGRRDAYAAFYAEGAASRSHWIEPKPVTRPTPAQGSLDAWPFAIPHDHEPQPTGHIPEAP